MAKPATNPTEPAASRKPSGTIHDTALEGQERDRVRETYGEKYERLAAIKAKYDPQNIFHRNVNIEPA